MATIIKTRNESAAIQMTGVYRLGNDIDLSGALWTPLGTSTQRFEGEFDGDGYTISHMTIVRTGNDSGLFGYVGVNGTIENLMLTEVSVTVSSGGGTAGMAGFCRGTIRRCGVTGSVVGSSYVGLLVGRTWDVYCQIEQCFAVGYVTTVLVSNFAYVGGLISHFQSMSTAQDCYARVVVGGSGGHMGGFIGYISDNTALRCYAAGPVSSESTSNIGGFAGRLIAVPEDTGSFWDIEVSGQTTSAAGTGKTTAQMKDINTFTQAGWDFETTWGIDPQVNDGYPYLRAFEEYPFVRPLAKPRRPSGLFVPLRRPSRSAGLLRKQ